MPPKLCYVFTAPSGAARRQFWHLTAAEGLPSRTLPATGDAEGDAPGAVVHTLWPVDPLSRKPRVGEFIIPKADVYVAVGREATLALVSGKLSPRYQGVADHASSVVREAHGTTALPPGSAVVAVNFPGYVPQDHKARQAALFGGEEWYPSQRLSLRRVRMLLDGTMPVAPVHDFRLFSDESNITDLVIIARAAGGVAIDLETPRSCDAIYVGAFAVGNEVWVFGEEGTIAAAKALFSQESIKILGQNSTTFDLPILREHGVPWPSGVMRDLRWLHSKTNPRMPHDLCSIGAHVCPWAPPNHKPMSEAPPMSAGQRHYCAVDAWITYWAVKELEKEFV